MVNNGNWAECIDFSFFYKLATIHFIVVTSNINSIQLCFSSTQETSRIFRHITLARKVKSTESCTLCRQLSQTHPWWWWWRWVWRMRALVLLSTRALGCYVAWLAAQWFPRGECAAPSHTAAPAAIFCCESRPSPRSLDRPEENAQREEEKS